MPNSIIVLGDRSFEVVSALKENEVDISQGAVKQRAKAFTATIEDARWFRDHADEIPSNLRGKIIMVFPAWILWDLQLPQLVSTCYWNGEWWILDWEFTKDLGIDHYFIRRIK